MCIQLLIGRFFAFKNNYKNNEKFIKAKGFR